MNRSDGLASKQRVGTVGLFIFVVFLNLLMEGEREGGMEERARQPEPTLGQFTNAVALGLAHRGHCTAQLGCKAAGSATDGEPGRELQGAQLSRRPSA